MTKLRPILAISFALMCTAATAIAAEDAHGGEDPSLFTGDLGNVLWTMIIFGLVLFILGKFAWKPMLSALQERERTIHDALVDAKRERQEADALLAKYQEQINRAREEATEIIEKGKQDAEDVQRRLHEEARNEADKMVERAKREIQLATDGAVKELYDRTANLAVGVAGQIIRKELSPDDHKQLVDEALQRIQASDEARLN